MINIIFLQTKEAAIKALVELDDQGGKDKFNIIYISRCPGKF